MSENVRTVTLTIDGRQLSVPFGTTILDAARRLDIDIPTLCEHEWLHRLGSCRLCLVKIEGLTQPVASCTTVAGDGMVVTTHDEELRRLRVTQMQFILMNHPLDCPVCDKAGECRLQDLTYALGVTEVPYRATTGEQRIDTLSPLIERNDKRCIRCGRCVAVCEEVQGVGALKFIGRGYQMRITTRDDGPLDCEFCGQCVAVCPVGALLPRPFKHKARVWDLEPTTTVCGYCGAGCQLVMHTLRDRIYRVTGDSNSINEGKLCIRGRFGWDIVHDERRLTSPLLKRDAGFVAVTWDEALEAVAEGIRHALATGGPEAVGVLAGPRLPIEDAYLLAYVFGAGVGTRRVAVAGQDAYGEAMKVTFDRLGRAGSTASFRDLREADVIFLLGSDLAAEMPVPHLAVLAAVREGDAKLIQAHPTPTKLDNWATARLCYRPGGQVALLLLLIKQLLEMKRQNRKFLAEHTDGFIAFGREVNKLNAAELAAQCGLAVTEVDEAVRQLAAARHPVIVLGSQALAGAAAAAVTHLVLDLLMLLGKIEDGLLLSTERNNLVGVMLAGLVPGRGPGLTSYDQVPAGWPRLPEEPGLGYAGIIEAGQAGHLGALLSFGANPLVQNTKAETLRSAMKETPFVVVCDAFMTETAKLADVILPTTTFPERGGHIVSAERRVLESAQVVPAHGEAWPEWRILLELAAKLDFAVQVESPAEIWDEAISVIPPLRAAAPLMKGREGALLPRRILQADEKLPFGTLPTPPPPLGGELILTAGTWFTHNGTLTQWSKAIAEVAAAPRLDLHPDDAAKFGLAEGDIAWVENEGVRLSATVRLNGQLPPGVAFAPTHFAAFPVGRLLRDCPCAPVKIGK